MLACIELEDNLVKLHSQFELEAATEHKNIAA